MKSRYWSAFPAVLTALFLFLSVPLRAQVPNASVSGVVSDPSGAVVPNATVTVTNVGTGIAVSTKTDNAGLYRVSSLIPGVYRINVSATGFKTVVKDQVQLNVQAAVSLNFTMQLGSVTESVTVSAGAPLVETQSASLGQVITGTQVLNTPLNGRNPMNLVSLAPSVVPQGVTNGPAASNQSSGFSNPAGFDNYQIGGGIAGWNAVFLDGIPLAASGQNWQALVPTQNSVSEFKVVTNDVSPQYGRFAGGVINFSTASGTNAYHGSVYDYLRNTVLDANSFFNNLRGQPRNVLEQNQFGGTVGGPIKRNKTFFFTSIEAIRLATTSAYTAYVPTPAEMGGDFRNSPATLASGVSIDPLTGQQAVCNNVLNTICSNELDSTAQAMYNAGYFQPVDQTLLNQLISNGLNHTSVNGNTPGHPFDVEGIGKRHNNDFQWVGRLDHQLTQNQRLFGRYTYWHVHIPPALGQSALPLFKGGLNYTTNQLGLGDTLILSPTMTAQFLFGYTRFIYVVGNNDGFDLSQLGTHWADIAPQLTISAPPSFFPAISWPNMPFSLDLLQNDRSSVWSFSGGFTKVAGKHTVTFGGELRRVEYQAEVSITPSGNFNFLGQNGVENFVQGVIAPFPAFDNVTTEGNPYAFSYYEGLYVNDTFQMTPKLTLDYGLRWEVPGAWHSDGNRGSVLLPNVANPLGSITNPVSGDTQQLMGVIAALDSPAYRSSTQTQEHWHLFDPRVGVAYSINPATVIRAGFGISNPCIDCGSVATEVGGSPVNSARTLPSPTTHGSYTFLSLSNPFPNGVLQPPGHSTQLMDSYSQFPQSLLGGTVGGQNPYQQYAYVMQWNLNIQRSFGSTVSLTLGYTGSSGVHLGPNNINLNQLPDKYDNLGSQLLTQVANPLAADVAPANTALSGATANYGQYLLPYPEFTQFISNGKYYGHSNYNALVFQISKRLPAGRLSASYTWAHFISNVDSQNGYLEPGQSQTGFGPQDFTNPQADKSNSAADVPQRLVINYIYPLPFGKGHRFLSGVGGALNRVVSGWSVSGITTFQTGLPLGFTAEPTVLSSVFGAGTPRPNVVSGCARDLNYGHSVVASGQPVFNTLCFQSPDPYGFGNESRLDAHLRSEGVNNFDISLAKTTSITELLSIEFRAEAYNIVNRTQFGPPNTQQGNGAFGVVSSQVNQPRIMQFALSLKF